MPNLKIEHTTRKNFSSLIRNYEFTRNDGLQFWRERILNGLILIILIFGSIAMIPNLIASITDKNILIITIDLFVYCSFLLLVIFRRNIKLKLKVAIVISLIYVLSITLLLTLGPMGPGLIWLASASLIAALLLGLNASIVTIIVNVFIIIIIAFLIHIEWSTTFFFKSYTALTWLAVSSNIIVVNSITSIPLALLLEALGKSINSEKELRKELISYNKQLKEEKIKVLESDRLKSAFLANLSHDIRTPMNAIMGFSELIEMECEQPRMKGFSRQILLNSKYLQNLIDDIVDISIIESGQIKLNYSTLLLESVFNELKPLVEALPYWKDRNSIELIYPDCELLKQKIEIDSSKLKQVLINLISNAIKYTPSGRIKISIYKKEHNIEFKIKDNGIGIPQSEQHKIFDRFSKVTRQKGPTVHGIGLGLSICKAIIESMNGKLWFKSIENEGSTFYFSIPIKAKTNA